jgi:hypothetical protein
MEGMDEVKTIQNSLHTPGLTQELEIVCLKDGRLAPIEG